MDGVRPEPGVTAANAFGRAGGVKSGRGGRALLAGLLTCGRCGRRLPVVYAGKTPRPTYRCDRPNLMLGLKRCLGFGGARVEAAVASELIRAVEPMAIEAALESERMHMESITNDVVLWSLNYSRRNTKRGWLSGATRLAIPIIG